MRFESPHYLHLLWLLILMIPAGRWLMKRHQQSVERFVSAKLSPVLIEQFSLLKFRLKHYFLLAFFIITVLALARPQWGFHWQEVRRQGIDILIAIDTSKSMLTQDVKPTRLERTKYAVKDLLKKLRGDRVGLIAFAGNAFVMCPLTNDYSGFLLSLNDLNSDTIPRGGTSLEDAITLAVESYDHSMAKHKAVILVTDGENLEGEPLVAAQKASAKGIKIFTVGIGTSEGELIRFQDKDGQWQFMKDSEGNFIKSRLNESLLRQIAAATDGAYVRSSGAQFGLDLIYENQLSKMEKREFEESKQRKYHERYQIPVALALLVLMIDSLTAIRMKANAGRKD